MRGSVARQLRKIADYNPSASTKDMLMTGKRNSKGAFEPSGIIITASKEKRHYRHLKKLKMTPMFRSMPIKKFCRMVMSARMAAIKQSSEKAAEE